LSFYRRVPHISSDVV